MDRKALLAKAKAAGVALSETSSRAGSTVAISWEHLRVLVCAPDARYVRLICEDESWAIRRSRLRKIRAALRRMGQIVTWLDEHGLHLRWHDGRGGLDLPTDKILAYGDTSSFDVTVGKHEAPVVEAPAPPSEASPASVPTEEPAPGPGLAVVLPEDAGAYTVSFWRAFHAACGGN
jgi:hypothetical protein